MSIQKINLTYVRQESKSFTTLYNEVIQNIKDGFNLGVYCYLSSLPHDWTVNKKHLMNHFGVGKDKITNTMSWLKSNHLLEYIQERNDDHTFSKSVILVKDGREFVENIVKNQKHNTGILKIRTPENQTDGRISRSPDFPVTGKQAPTYINIDTNKIEKKKINKAQPKNQVAVVDLPKWIDPVIWEEFKQHRKDMKKPMSELAQKKTLNQLDKMRSKGQNVEDVLNQSIANGWQGVFEVKSFKENHHERRISNHERVWNRNTRGLPEFDKNRREGEVYTNAEGLSSATDFLF